MPTTNCLPRFAATLIAVLAAFGCSSSDPSDPPEGSAGAADGVGGSAGLAGSGNAGEGGAAGGTAGSGGLPPQLNEVPGGEVATSPVVGCEDAERPARRDDAATEICEAVGSARCWYADPNGDDTGDGSFSSPLRTPQEAVRQAKPGDVIYLRGGVYDVDNAHVAGVGNWSDPASGTKSGILSLTRLGLPAWAGGDDYSVASGTAEAPITVRSFPNERACVDGAGSIRIGSLSQETAHWIIDGLTLRHGGVLIGGGSRGDADEPVNQTHHITLRRMEISHFSGKEKDNTGLVRVDRGDWGGPYDIVVESNILHDLYVIDEGGTTHDPLDGHDAQHFGAVTALSCESYVDPSCVGNGALTIRNNHIYRTPSAVFLKNPSLGPFLIEGNVIHDVHYLGQWSPANITFANNLAVGGGGIAHGGFGGATDDAIWLRSGRNLRLENNTFIGFDAIVEFRIWASGHTIRGNVIQGPNQSMADANWDHMGLVHQGHPWVHPDTASSIEESRLAKDNDFDDNCYVTPVADFILYGRRNQLSSGEWQLEHVSLDQARNLLGFDHNSDRVDAVESVFAAFASKDYRIATGPCAGRGAAIPHWWSP